MFPLHVCERVVSHIPLHRRQDLYTLLLTDKTFHSAAEPVLYSYNIFTDVRRIHLFTQTLTKLNPRLALHVRTFGINLHDYFYRIAAVASTAVHRSALSQVTQHEFWDDVQAALSLMERLETLVLIEMARPKVRYWTQILDSERPYPFALAEIKLHLTCDDHLTRFLNAQAALGGRLRAVRMYNTASDEDDDENGDYGRLVKSEELVLPDVETLDISISIAPYIRPKSLAMLARLQLFFDSFLSLNKLSLPQLLTILSNLINTPSRLRGLSLLELPYRLSTATLIQHIAKLTNTTLSHLSHLHLPEPYPAKTLIKSRFLACLFDFPRLSSIELSLDSWDPAQHPSPPNSNTTMGPGIPPAPFTDMPPPQFQLPTPASQKALVCELKMYCPTLRTVVFWYGKVRMRWAFVSDGLPFQFSTSSTTTAGGKGPSGTTTTTTTTTTPSGSGGNNNVERARKSPRRIDNAASSGDWHYRVESGQWPGYSRLWHSC